MGGAQGLIRHLIRLLSDIFWGLSDTKPSNYPTFLSFGAIFCKGRLRENRRKSEQKSHLRKPQVAQ